MSNMTNSVIRSSKNNLPKRSFPKFAKGTRRKVEVSCTAWIDLLGYGSAIAEAGFNPFSPMAARALERLQDFHEIVVSHSHLNLPLFIMNDGAAAYRDISVRTNFVTRDFICRCFALFTDINEREARKEFPGARMVIAPGFRVRAPYTDRIYQSGKLDSIRSRLADEEISVNQAVMEAWSTPPRGGIVPELQANFGFSKAYLAEQSGSKGGLPGANCYIDTALFSDPLPTWMELGPEIQWSHKTLGLKASFKRVVLMNPPTNDHHKKTPGILDAIEIAKRLTADSQILEAFHKGRIRTNRR